MQIGAVLHSIILSRSIVAEGICIQCFVSLSDIALYHTCIMDKEGICSLKWILYIDCKAIFTNGGHYQNTSGRMSDEILSKLNLGAADQDIKTFPLLLSCTLILVSLDSCYYNACHISHCSRCCLCPI